MQNFIKRPVHVSGQVFFNFNIYKVIVEFRQFNTNEFEVLVCDWQICFSRKEVKKKAFASKFAGESWNNPSIFQNRQILRIEGKCA